MIKEFFIINIYYGPGPNLTPILLVYYIQTYHTYIIECTKYSEFKLVSAIFYSHYL